MAHPGCVCAHTKHTLHRLHTQAVVNAHLLYQSALVLRIGCLALWGGELQHSRRCSRWALPVPAVVLFQVTNRGASDVGHSIVVCSVLRKLAAPHVSYSPVRWTVCSARGSPTFAYQCGGLHHGLCRSKQGHLLGVGGNRRTPILAYFLSKNKLNI